MGRKPVLAIAGALLAGVTLSGCETGRPYYDGPRSYLPSQGYRGGPYTQNGTMYSQPQMVAGAAYAPRAMAMKPAPVEVTPTVQLASSAAPAGATPMLTITMPAVRFQVPLTGAITYAQTPGTPAAGPASVEQVPAASPDNQVMQATTPPAVPAPAPSVPPPVPFTVPTVQSTNYTPPARPLAPLAPSTASSGQGATGLASPMPTPVQYLPPVSPTPPADAVQLSSDVPPPPVWPKTPGEGVEETMSPPVPPPIHRGPATGTVPAAPVRPTLYYQ